MIPADKARPPISTSSSTRNRTSCPGVRLDPTLQLDRISSAASSVTRLAGEARAIVRPRNRKWPGERLTQISRS